jgi:hypothetical protein
MQIGQANSPSTERYIAISVSRDSSSCRPWSSITTRQLLFEKEIVEMAVEQSPVHIERDIVDLVPIQLK